MLEDRPTASIGTDIDVAEVRPGASVSAAEWHQADSRLRELAARRATLDADEARWLLLARRVAVHQHLGFASFAEYMERVLGYGPHVAGERLRVAEALERLPSIREALASGRVPFSAVREVTRVATPETELPWLAAIEGRTLREIEPLVAGRRPGDLPSTPADPRRLRHTLRFDVSASTLALLRDARRTLEEEVGHRLDDDQLVATLCHTILRGPDDPGRANYQIAITTCDTCERAWQDGSGAEIEVPPEVVERARCDAQHIGRVDSAEPMRATQDVPPALRRLILRRDHGRCVVPGCRSARFLEVHHIVWRANGGEHTADNCCTMCTAHHTVVHAGRLIITGTMATGLSFAHADGRPYGAAPLSSIQEDAAEALHRLGFTIAESRAAVAAATSHGGGSSLVDVIRRALAATRRADSSVA